jgi:polysaccharide biosynthesis transport protein
MNRERRYENSNTAIQKQAGFEGESSSVREYLRILFRQKTIWLITVLTVVGVVVVSLSLKTPLYEAQVKMLISAEKLVQAPYYREIGGSGKNEVLLTQSEIVKSAPILERTVKALNLDQKKAAKQQIAELKQRWREIKKKIKSKFNTQSNIRQQPNAVFRKAVKELRKNINVEPVRGTNLFTIRVKAYEPNEAAVLANVVSRSYVIYDLEQQLADLSLKYGKKHPIVKQLQEGIIDMSKQLHGQPISNIKAIGPATVKVIEQATAPFEPYGLSKIKVLLAGIVVSVMLGTLLAFVFEHIDPAFKSVQDVENRLNIEIMGSIPKKRFGDKLVCRNSNTKSVYNNYYHNLADQIRLTLKERDLKSLLIISADKHKKSTEITANLGMLFSQKTECNVLLLDANMRTPQLHDVLRVKNTVGLAEVLEDKVQFGDVINRVNKQLHVLTAGRTNKNPLHLIESEKVGKILAQAKKDNEFILVACPAMNGQKDSVVLAGQTDAVVLVVDEGRTRPEVVQAMMLPLIEKQRHILGVIVNNRTFPIPNLIYNWF